MGPRTCTHRHSRQWRQRQQCCCALRQQSILGRQKQCSSNAVCLCSCNHDAKLVLATKRNYALLPGTCKKNNTHLQVASSGAIMWQHTSIPVHNAHVTQHMWPALCSLGGGTTAAVAAAAVADAKAARLVFCQRCYTFFCITPSPLSTHTPQNTVVI